MYTIRYVKDDETYDVDAVKLDANRVEVKGDYPVRTDGFYLSRKGIPDNWDYTKYTTIYKEVLDGAIFSNDGSVEPEPVEPEHDEYMVEEES